MRKLFIGMGLALVALSSAAQDPTELFLANNNTASRAETASQWAGESVSAMDRELSWEVVDLSVPGNGPAISVGRTFTSVNSPRYKNNFLPFSRWQLSVPQIDLGVWSVLNSLLEGCGNLPHTKNLSVRIPGTSGFREIAQNSSQIAYPSGTFMHFENNWILKCEAFTTRSNSTDATGSSLPQYRTDGLTLVSPDGTTYRFSFRAQETNQMTDVHQPPVDVYTYYVSDIEDQWGNYVAFDYATFIDNYWGSGENDPVIKLMQIRSSDDRTVTFSYNADNFISTIAYSGRTISYSYDAAKDLRTVTYPGAAWEYTYYPGDATIQARQLQSVQTPQGALINYEYSGRPVIPCGLQYLAGPSWLSRRTVQNRSNTYVYDYSTASTSAVGYQNAIQTNIVGPASTNVYVHGCATTSSTSNTPDALDYKLLKHQVLQSSILQREEAFTWTKITYTGTYRNTFAWASRTPQRVVLSNTTIDNTYTRQVTGFDPYGNDLTANETGNGLTRTGTYAYFSSTSRWVIGLRSGESYGSDLVIARTYNSNGQMLSETKNGATTNFGYTNRFLTSTTSPRGYVTTYGDFYRGVPRLTTLPIGATQ